jgi:hypothetical protein
MIQESELRVVDPFPQHAAYGNRGSPWNDEEHPGYLSSPVFNIEQKSEDHPEYRLDSHPEEGPIERMKGYPPKFLVGHRADKVFQAGKLMKTGNLICPEKSHEKHVNNRIDHEEKKNNSAGRRRI